MPSFCRSSFYVVALILTAASLYIINPARAAGMVMDRLETGSLVQPASHAACYPQQTYVLGHNFYRACILKGKPPRLCQRLAVRCRSCWAAFLSCRARIGHLPGYSCQTCSNRYAYCIRPFLGAIGH
jgi:hypothetical protein